MNIYELSEELYLEMLEIVIGFMNENEACAYCKLYGNCDAHIGLSDDYCKNNLFEGIKAIAEKRIEDKENETFRNDAA